MKENTMNKNVLLVGRKAIVLDDVRKGLAVQDVTLFSASTLDDVRKVLDDHSIDMVIMGAGIDLDTRVQIVRHIFEASNSITVHLKTGTLARRASFRLLRAYSKDRCRPNPTARKSAIVLGVKPIARGCGELPGCRSTSTVGTPRQDRKTAADRQTRPPPTTSTEAGRVSIVSSLGSEPCPSGIRRSLLRRPKHLPGRGYRTAASWRRPAPSGLPQPGLRYPRPPRASRPRRPAPPACAPRTSPRPRRPSPPPIPLRVRRGAPRRRPSRSRSGGPPSGPRPSRWRPGPRPRGAAGPGRPSPGWAARGPRYARRSPGSPGSRASAALRAGRESRLVRRLAPSSSTRTPARRSPPSAGRSADLSSGHAAGPPRNPKYRTPRRGRPSSPVRAPPRKTRAHCRGTRHRSRPSSP